MNIKSKRLSTDDKYYIRKNALDFAFKKRLEKIKEEENRIALLIYTEVYPPETLKHMAALGEMFFSKKNYFYVAFCGDVDRLDMLEEKCFSYEHVGYSRALIKYEEGKIYDVFEKNKTAKRALETEKDNAWRVINSTLDSVRTTKQLVDLWPEGAQFLPEESRVAASAALTVPIADLNKMLSLKTVEAKG